MVKVERSYPAPSSLAIEKNKPNGSYSEDDVVNTLISDFQGKCYICERDNLQAPVVEHLLPHKNGRFRDRMFDWDNLFLACSYCNGIKNNIKYDEGILDCCKEDPEENIEFDVDNSKALFVLLKDTEVNRRTVSLLEEVYNGPPNTVMRKLVCSNLFKDFTEEMNAFYVTLNEYLEFGGCLNSRALRGFLKRESPFAAFKRCYIRKYYAKSDELMDMIA